MSDLFALLIAVDNYFELALPDGTYYPKLGGCVRDVNHVYAFLTDKGRVGLTDDRIIRLTASIGPGAEPPEPRERWPTYHNMVMAFKQITAMAQPGDQVYIHYAGHGGRTVTAYPEIKGPQGVDEALVPLDIGDPTAQYLRDIEVHTLIQNMVDKGIVLTVVFDCCHSGGATRALTQGTNGARARGIGRVDTTVRPLQQIVAPLDDLAAAWNATAVKTRAVKPASGWLLEPSGYTFLAACRANESAYEFPFDGLESNGALTYWMLDTLRNAGSNLSYRQMHERILAKVHSQFALQTPMLQGDGDVQVFGVARIPPQYAVAVLQVNAAADSVQLNAGEAQGVKTGARFAIYPLGAADLSDAAASIATVEVTDVSEVDCFAKVVEIKGAGLDAGAQAVLQSITDVRLQRGVLVDIADPSLQQALQTAIQASGKGFVALAGAGVPVDFQVAVNAAGDFEIQDPGDQPIPNLRPAVAASAAGVGKVVERLVHLAKYANVRELDVPDPGAPQYLQVALKADSGATDGRAITMRPGDRAKLVITNLQQPNPADPNDPARVLNVTVLGLNADWSVEQAYPAEAGKFEPVDPGQTIELPFPATLEDDHAEETTVFKVFGTRATTAFRWLELPALDQPDLAAAGMRGEISDPLEALLARFSASSAAQRKLKFDVPSTPAERRWTVAQVEVLVKQ